MKTTYLLYDRRRFEFQIPAHWHILEPTDPPAVVNCESAVLHALENPINSQPLVTIAKKADKTKSAVIVVSDITRSVPNRLFLPTIIHELLEGGFSEKKITILIATGMHRPSTPAERIELLGESLAERFNIVDHLADDEKTLTELPNATQSGTRVRIDSTYFNAGLKILTGFIEPHFMAGFSGGRKSICPGLVDLTTLQKFHGAKFLFDPRARIGNLDGNPCHREALEIANMVRPDFIFNVTVGTDGGITGIFAGDMEAAHAAGVEFVRRTMTIKVDRPFDCVFTSGGGYPLDTTFYQTVKGMVTAGQYVRKGGQVICVSGCAAGIGSESYRTIMFRYRDYHKFLGDILKSDRTELDQWEFQMHTRVLEKTGVAGLIMVCDRMTGEDLRRCHVTPAESITGAGTVETQVVSLIRQIETSNSRVAWIPRGPYILPEVAEA